MFETDLYIIHAPSVYDFRNYPTLLGPISDVIPSSPIFEMYPVGITSIADYLENRGYRVQIINLAYLMLKDNQLDVEKYLSKLKSKAFALDLHWLPHCHGSIEIAKILKKYHPEIPIIMGGLSASYFHEELIEYPAVDYVVRGDSTEDLMYRLMERITKGGPFHLIPNLTWKDHSNKKVINEFSYSPLDMDYTNVPSYKYAVRSVFRYGKLHSFIPYLGWLQYPNTAVLTARGCTVNCSICGGSKSAFKNICHRNKPAFRSPEKLIEDIRFIKSLSRAPIFIIHDIRQGGKQYWNRFLDLLAKEKVENEFVFELFRPAEEEFFKKINASVKRYSLEMTIESHDEKIRQFNGKFRCTNLEVENTLKGALDNGCRKVDIFFMIGIPRQTYPNAMETITYCRSLLEKFNGDNRLCLFTAPLAPFLDPGSPAFENPEKFGYKKFCFTLEDHRQALLNLSWQDVLSYETKYMSREEIVKATYDSAEALNELKLEFNLISPNVYSSVKEKIQMSRNLLKELNTIKNLPIDKKEKALNILQETLLNSNRHSICGKDELKWPTKKRFASLPSLTLLLFKILIEIGVLEFKRASYKIKPLFKYLPINVKNQKLKGIHKQNING